MAYWREYHNKYGALINRTLIYTAKDRAKQHERTYNRAPKVPRRVYRTSDREQSIRYFIRTGNPEFALFSVWYDRCSQLACKRAQLNLTRAILAGKRDWNSTVTTEFGIIVGIHLSGNLDVIREAINHLEYEIKFLGWVIASFPALRDRINA